MSELENDAAAPMPRCEGLAPFCCGNPSCPAHPKETSEPEGSVCICGGDGVRYTLGAERDCPVHGFPRTSEPEGGGSR